MGGLADRTEHALIGALIASPVITPEVDCLAPPDFASLRSAAAYQAIMALPRTRHDGAGQRLHAVAAAAAALPGGAEVTPAWLAAAAATCPQPRHAPAYAALVVQAKVLRDLHGATAITGLDAALTATGPHPLHHPAPQQHREEHVLAALLRGHPESARILDFLPVAAMTDWYRQDMLQAIRRLHTAASPIDALTTDWETALARTATGGQHLHARPAGTETYAMRLARADPGPGSPLAAARDLHASLDHRLKAGRLLNGWPSIPAQESRLLLQPPAAPGPAHGQRPGHRT